MIRVTYSKTVRGNAALEQALRLPMAIARKTAEAIRARILRGRTATPADPYKTAPDGGDEKRRPRYYVSPAYAAAMGRPGETRWQSSDEMHRAVGGVPGKATGTMLAGLQVRNYGTAGALIDFGGSSLGARSTRTAITRRVAGTFEVTLSADGKARARQVRELARDEGGDVKYRRKPRLERNAIKAATVWRHLHVGMLQPTDAESQAQADAVTHVVQRAVADAFGVGRGSVPANGVTPHVTTGDAALFRAIIKEFP